MWLSRSEKDVVVQAPAKLNLFFEVLGRRDDGYHEVETLMCPVSLFDTLVVSEQPSGPIEFTCSAGGGASGKSPPWLGDVPNGPENLVVRAVELLRRETGVSRGLRVQLTKRIPTAAGLGGGSSDAAAALVAASQAWNLDCSPGDLARLGAELGSDVPFFLENSPAICRGRGEHTEPIGGLGSLWFAVVRPPEGLSTAAVYRACQAAATPRSVGPLVDALRRGDLGAVGRLLFNRLESAAAGLCPWIDHLRRAFAVLDVVGHGMSGSGTSYFGLCRHARHALRVARRFQARVAGSVFAVGNCR